MADNIPRFNAQDFYTVETSPSVIKEEIRTALYNYLGYNPTDSDPRMLEAMALMPYIVQTRALADAAAKSALLTYAQGEELDRIADSTCVYGYMERLPARRAVMWVRLDFEVGTRGNAHYSGSFEAGGVTWSGEGDFNLTWDAEAYGKYYVPFYADSEGSFANGIDSHVIANLASIIASSVNVDYEGGTAAATIADVYHGGNYWTEIPTCGGRDAESDEEFAKRISEQMRALRVPGSVDYFNFVARQVSSIVDSYTSNELDSDGHVQMWYSTPFAYAITDCNGHSFVVYCGDSDIEFYDEYREAISTSKPVGIGIVVSPAYHAIITGFSTTVGLTVYSGMTLDEESELISKLYQKMVAEYNEKIGIVMRASDVQQWAQELGAVSADTEFYNLSHDLYQTPPNVIAPVLPLNISVISRISRELSPVSSGGAGEEVL